VTILVKNLLGAYEESIKSLDWMNPETIGFRENYLNSKKVGYLTNGRLFHFKITVRRPFWWHGKLPLDCVKSTNSLGKELLIRAR
jgi:hypothetical protein